ncbi:hypothetical protein GCM10027422_37960 [Hymenobacter arcticus]
MKKALVYQIEVILENENNALKGSAFEKMIRNVLRIQRYNVQPNVNYTGLEIDLEASHMDRNEKLYVECKAKERVSATEISKFCFNVDFKEADLGYFIRTKELEHQAAGLVNELKDKKKYKNLTFFSPEKIIDILISHNLYKLPQLSVSDEEVSKMLLAVTYMGDFFVYVLNKTSRGLPSHFMVFNAINGAAIDSNSIINVLTERISDITGLEIIEDEILSQHVSINNVKIVDSEINSISPVLESENWFDYLPASIKHFIGRDALKKEVFSFFQRVAQSDTKKRVFYLNSKSGWGKSSMIVYLKGKCMSDYYKNKFYLYGIDSRSILSSNFPALSFQAAIDSALKDGFIGKAEGFENLQFTSGTDVLSSDSVKSLLEYLQKKSKVLIIVFDQFEDIFRKQGYFKAFYKFLIDVNNAQTNLIIGFSWKTEILIPSENESYYLWQLAKEQAESFSIPEFGPKEIGGVIKQLEDSVGNLRMDLKRSLIEGSQGFPWLIKKFCIHVYNQVQSGVLVDDLVESGVKFQDLFDKDLENLNGDEIKSLNYIAKRAYDSKFFDETEVGDIIKESIISSLRDKRLIIKSGVNYNIYWDIFRDYLVNGTVPVIGETYILRASYKGCLAVFLQFRDGKDRSMDDIRKGFPRKIQENSLNNILAELRSIGLLAKRSDGNYYIVEQDLIVSVECFKVYIRSKFSVYTPYIELAKIKHSKFSSFDVVSVLKKIFKGYSYQDKTWKMYAATLINWFKNAGMDIANNYKAIRSSHVKSSSAKDLGGAYYSQNVPRLSPASIIQYFEAFKAGEVLPNRISLELRNFELIFADGSGDYVAKEFNAQDTSVEDYIRNRAKSIDKIDKVVNYLGNNQRPKSSDLQKDMPELFEGRTTVNSRNVAASNLINWARFSAIDGASALYARTYVIEKSIIITISRVAPKLLLEFLYRLDEVYFETSQDKIKLRALMKLGLVVDDRGIYVLSREGQNMLKISSDEDKLTCMAELAMKDEKFKQLLAICRDNMKSLMVEEALKKVLPESFSRYSALSLRNRALTIKSWMSNLL